MNRMAYEWSRSCGPPLSIGVHISTSRNIDLAAGHSHEQLELAHHQQGLAREQPMPASERPGLGHAGRRLSLTTAASARYAHECRARS